MANRKTWYSTPTIVNEGIKIADEFSSDSGKGTGKQLIGFLDILGQHGNRGSFYRTIDMLHYVQQGHCKVEHANLRFMTKNVVYTATCNQQLNFSKNASNAQCSVTWILLLVKLFLFLFLILSLSCR